MRTRLALWNLLSNLLLQIVTAISGFIIPALLIVHYGSVANGLIGSIKQFMAYLSLVEAGVGAASIAALYRPLAERSESRINAILSATRSFYRKSGYVFLALLLVLAVAFPLVVRGQVGVVTSSLMVLVIGVGGVAEYFFLGKFRVLVTADQRGYILFLVQACAIFLSTSLTAFLVIVGTRLLVVQTVATVVYYLRVFLIQFFVRRLYPFVRFDAEADVSAIHDRWSAFGHQVAGLIVFNSPVVVLSLFGTLQEVSVYLVYAMVFSAVGLLIGSFSSGLLAGFGELFARGDNWVVQRAFANFEYIYFAVMTWAYVCTALLIMPFLRIYTRRFSDANYLRPELAVLFLVVGVANNVRVPSNVLVVAAGHFRQTRSRAFAEAGINVMASLLLVRFFGVVGVLLSSVLSYSYRTVDLILYASRRLLSESPGRTVRSLLLNGVLGCICIVPFWLWIHISPDSIVHWFGWAVSLASAVFIVVCVGNYLFDGAMFRMSWRRISLIRNSVTQR